MPSVVRSICPFDCPDACGLLVEVEPSETGSRVRKVRGDDAHPYSQGSLCPKMTGYDRTVHSPDRLTRPLIRTGKKGAGEFRPASWDEALAVVTARWQQIIA